MTRDEEELQKLIESLRAAGNDPDDAIAYKKVFEALSNSQVSVSHDFADKVIARVIEKQRKSDAKDLFWLAAGLFFLLMAFIGTIIYTGFRLNLGFLEEMSGYSGLFVFGIAFIILLNWIDKRILSSKRTS